MTRASIRDVSTKERNTNMTLEKLLIFGFALAALVAINTIGTGMFEDLSTRNDDFESGTEDVAGAGF
jgi:hypothetical protein